MADYCSCGFIRQNKVGIDEHADGLKVCRGCGLPLFDAARVTGASADRASAAQQVLIVTTNDVPGYQIDEVHGDVFGLTVRARNIFSGFGASVRTVVGGRSRDTPSCSPTAATRHVSDCGWKRFGWMQMRSSQCALIATRSATS